MNLDENLYVFLEDYPTISQWRGDVVLGKTIKWDSQVEHIQITQHFPRKIVTVPIKGINGELIIREVSQYRMIHGRNLSSDFEDVLVINSTFLGWIGWIHYTEPFFRNKQEVSAVLEKLKSAEMIKVELFIQDHDNEGFDDNSEFHLIASRIDCPQNILCVYSDGGGSCWFEATVNSSQNWIVRVGGREGSWKSRNWFQPGTYFEKYSSPK
jgi:hypothetical protein